MKKFRITTEKIITNIYLLTYEIEAETEPTLEDLARYTPTDEEFYLEQTDEKIIDIDEV